MGGSQLSQLKSALRDSGLSRQSKPKDKKKRKQLSSQSLAQRSDKLAALDAKFNQFDTRDEKKKFAVVTRNGKLDGEKKTKSEPGKSKSIGLENRKKTLLPLLDARNHTSVIVDHRFGEGRANMSPEEKMLERFKAERVKKGSKLNKFNIEQDDALTHGGQKLGFGDEEELEDGGGWGGGAPALNRSLPDDADEQEDDEQTRKRSRTEIMNEVVAKSKAYKHERQRIRAEDDDLRMELDAGLNELRSALSGRPAVVVEEASSAAPKQNDEQKVASEEESEEDEEEEDSSDASSLASDDDDDNDEDDEALSDEGSTVELDDEAFGELLQATSNSKVNRELLLKLIGRDGKTDPTVKPSSKPIPAQASAEESTVERAPPQPEEKEVDDDPYDSYVKLLAMEPRVQASNRLKTPLELAQEAADKLRAEEEARLKRQRGERVDASDDEEGGPASKKRKRKPEADDLEDDYVRDTFEADEDEELGLGAGLQDNEGSSDGELVVADEDDVDDADDDSDEEDGDDEEDEEDFGGIEVGDIEASSSEEEDADSDEEQDEVQQLVAPVDTTHSTGKGELPYTFPCPTTHAEFAKLLRTSGIKDEDTATVVKRIRVLYHPGLAEGNKAKLQSFTCVLLDHILFLAGKNDANAFETINSLLPSFLTLCHAFPLTTAPHFIDKLALMQKNLSRGLSQGVLEPKARTWPGSIELTLLRLVGLVWSTSDLSHPVGASAMLLITQYLSQARIRSLQDIASGLFLCALASQYESLSKRLVPETMTFLLNSLLVLVPTSFKKEGVPGDFAIADFAQPHLKQLKLDTSAAKGLSPRKLEFASSLAPSFSGPQAQVDLSATALDLLLDFYETSASRTAFIELARPAQLILDDMLSVKRAVAGELRSKVDKVSTSLKRMIKLAKSTRKPLTLQKHRAIPIATYIPKFDEGFNPNKRFDPDSARAEASKLRALYKREKKATVRELRNDNKFLAQEEQRRKQVKDKEYEKKISKIMSGLQDERAEEKAHHRAKESAKKKDKARSGGRRR